MMDLQIEDSRLAVAVRAAKEAGNEAEAVKRNTPSERKEDNTIVTEADRESERIIRDILQSEFTYPILGEEHGSDVTDEDTYWVVDPIDGTRNFSHEQPLYGCAIALVEDNEPTIGVWYMPELEYLFYAVSGNGAYRNGEKLSVSEETDPGQAYPILSGRGKENIYPMIASKTAAPQQTGSAVLSTSWVASGWCDVGLFASLSPWDIAAGAVLIREAGGVMKSITTEESEWNAISEGHVIFGNEVMVDSILSTFTDEDYQAVRNTR